eukprot:364805-Chlamydomonas_euryale.AAC.8
MMHFPCNHSIKNNLARGTLNSTSTQGFVPQHVHSGVALVAAAAEICRPCHRRAAAVTCWRHARGPVVGGAHRACFRMRVAGVAATSPFDSKCRPKEDSDHEDSNFENEQH